MSDLAPVPLPLLRLFLARLILGRPAPDPTSAEGAWWDQRPAAG